MDNVRTIAKTILYYLERIQCTSCPIRKSCDINICIYNKSICTELTKSIERGKDESARNI